MILWPNLKLFFKKLKKKENIFVEKNLNWVSLKKFFLKRKVPKEKFLSKKKDFIKKCSCLDLNKKICLYKKKILLLRLCLVNL